MTSQKSSPRSNNRRAFSPFLYSFYRALAENIPMPLGNLLWITLMVPVFTVLMAFSPLAESASAPDALPLNEQIKYIVLAQPDMTAVFLILGTCLFSGLTGVFLFRFMAAKKTVNVYYSLGIKRRSLFLAKYAAGAVLLAISVAVPMLACAFVNIHYVGSSPELWRAILYYMLALYLLAMLCMTVTAAVFSAVGTVFEGMSFSAVILLAPTILVFCINVLMSVVLWGNPYTAGGFTVGEKYIPVESLISMTRPYNPVFFAQVTLQNISAMDASGKINPMLYTENTFVAPNFWALLPWIAVIAACLGIALLVFQRRKAEICGFLGRNRALNFIIELVLGFGAFTVTINILYDRMDHALVALIAAAVYLVVYLILEAILTRSGKLLLKGLWKLPIHLAIALIAYAIFATGLFGYSTRIPDLSTVKEIHMDVDYDTTIYGTNNSPYTLDGYAMFDNYFDSRLTLSTEKDKELAAQIHQKLIDSRKDTDGQTAREISVIYVLNDGSYLLRNYDITTNDVLYETLRLYESDWSRQQMREVISSDPAMPEIPDTSESGGDADSITGTDVGLIAGAIESAVAVYQENYSDIPIPENSEYGYATGSVLLSNGVAEAELNLTHEQHTALKEALIADVTAQTAQQKFQPETAARYTLIFRSNIEVSYSDLNVGGVPLIDSGSTPYPLTPEMTHTLAFLEENGLLAAVSAELPAPASVTVRPVADLLSSVIYSGSTLSHFSRMFCSLKLDATPEYEDVSLGAAETSLTPEQFSQLSGHLFNYYYTRGQGYAVTATYPEQDITVSYYLPAQYAPDAVKAQLGA